MHINQEIARNSEDFRLLKRADICSDLAISSATFYRLVSDGKIPQPIKIGRAARWKSSDIVAFVEFQTLETKERGGAHEQAA